MTWKYPTAGEGVTCYVYYRVAPEAVEDARAAVATLLEAVNLATGITGTLSERIDFPELGQQLHAQAQNPARETVAPGSGKKHTPANAPTWMETYTPIASPAEFARHLRAAIEASGIERFLIPGQRRSLEWFTPMGSIAPCA